MMSEAFSSMAWREESSACDTEKSFSPAAAAAFMVATCRSYSIWGGGAKRGVVSHAQQQATPLWGEAPPPFYLLLHLLLLLFADAGVGLGLRRLLLLL